MRGAHCGDRILLLEAVRQSRIPAVEPVAQRTRSEIITRYRKLRAISKTHNNGAIKCMSWNAFREQARRLGVVHGKTFILNTEDELAYAQDLTLHGRREDATAQIIRRADIDVAVPQFQEVDIPHSPVSLRSRELRETPFALSFSGWRATHDSDDHYGYAIAL